MTNSRLIFYLLQIIQRDKFEANLVFDVFASSKKDIDSSREFVRVFAALPEPNFLLLPLMYMSRILIHFLAQSIPSNNQY